MCIIVYGITLVLLFWNSISSLYLFIQNKDVHDNSLLLLYIHDCGTNIIIPTYAIDSNQGIVKEYKTKKNHHYCGNQDSEH